jgi:hypothetical protein
MAGPSLALMGIKIATKKCRGTGIKSHPYIVPKKFTLIAIIV